ncbi:accessory gene regulator B family protein [Clostridium sp. HBUAS56017]|uniref:accessory gene regulator B family protein n=1 Tax=Clostridium sp. HBUAS56017 TaxID=2571128 RepID=UPI001178933E|nr:accessory gene regulator B family protein [Clostridium sp. HBUAS56017]
MKELLRNFNPCNFICMRMFNYFKKKLNLDPLQLEKLYLGIMVIMFNVLEFVVVFVVAFYIGVIKEALLFFIMFASIRCTAAGVHCKNNLACMAITLTSYIGASYISVKYPINCSLACIICVICAVLLCKYSPADTEKRPILGAKHRKKLKIQTTIMSSILILINLLLLNKNIFNLTMFALILETLSVLPWSYKLFKASYNNYKKYEVV